jgi:predicted transglutaminase-like cysteine proteinase
MKLLNKIWKWVESLWAKADDAMDKLIPVATSVVEGVKKAVENETVLDVLEVVKFAIPGDVDDKIINKAVQLTQRYIPKIALRLGIVNAVMKLDSVNEQMLAVVNALKESNNDQKSDYWHELAAFTLKHLADGKLTLGEAGAIVEYHYRNHIKK